MRAMLARFWVLLLVALLVRADSLDTAAGQLTAKILSHLAGDEVARLTWNDVTPASAALDAAAVVRLKTTVTRSLARRGTRKPVDITVTVSANAKDLSMLTAEIPREDGRIVEMVEFPRPPLPVSGPNLSIERTLLWQQADPILDVIAMGDRMLVLDEKSVTRYERRQGVWTMAEAAPIPMEPVRDPRGHLELSGDTIVAEVPGLTCRGSLMAPLSPECAAGGRLAAGRNTLEESGWPPHFSHATLGEDEILSEMDGRIHVYDRSHRSLGVFMGWSSDFAVIRSDCGGQQVVAAGDPPDQVVDTISLFDVVNHAPIRKSAETPLPGTVNAVLEHDSPVVVVRNLSSKQYEAYQINRRLCALARSCLRRESQPPAVPCMAGHCV
jgi:hypothetical protein